MKLLLATINPNVTNGAEDLTLALRIASPPQFGVALTSMQLYLEASGGAGGYIYSVTGLPSGYTMPNTATGEIVGSTTALHTVITASVTDGTNTVTVKFAINIANPLVGVDVTPPACEYPFTYSYQLSIAGATGTVTYALTTGALPTGLSVSSGGLISGTASASGTIGTTCAGVITASDSGTGCSLPIPFSIEHGAWDTQPGQSYTITVGVPTVVNDGQSGGAVPITYVQAFPSSDTSGAISVTY